VRKLAETNSQDWGIDGTLVLDDVFIDPDHTGTPDPDQRQWRTVGIIGLREGGSSYLATDVTQPDTFQSTTDGFFLPVYSSATEYVPTCLTSYSAASCGPVRFPGVLWEFRDNEIPDEDLNGARDLGDTWSIPNTGRLRVIEDGEEVDKFVVVVGGGMDPQKTDSAGDWLYILDVETGKPIYKRQLVGSAPSEPAAVDTDQDGYLDTIYIGTTAGLLYKTDVHIPAEIHDVTILGTTVQRIDDARWEPFVIFDTGGRPIYFPPAVIYVARLGRYALGFGTGDREDLWSDTDQDGRFYLILDEGFVSTDGFLPLDESEYEAIPAVGGEEAGQNFLLNPNSGRRPGWLIQLGTEERVITRTFSLSGVTIFTSDIPEVQIIGGGGGPGGGGPPNPGPGNDDAPICAKTGQSRIFVVFTDSANAVLTLEGQKTRFWLVSEFVTDPFTEQSATQNPLSSDPGHHSDEMTPELQEVMETLKGLFPDNCRFGNCTLNLKTVRSDTGVVFIAPIPVCIIEKNWKEF
jgi:Tfp pilus tip-associated adhesin PilY1